MVGLDHVNIKVNTLKAGDYFGEIGLITELKRTSNVTSMDYCTLSFLDKKAVLETKEQFPQIY